MDFDSAHFNRTLFFPRAIGSRAPHGATDHSVRVIGDGDGDGDGDDGHGDGEASLHLRIHHSPAARATVLFFHGNGEVVADYDDAAHAFAEAGASLAVVDYRGYGQSTGTPTLRGIINDAHAVLRELLTRVEGDVVVMGRSIGSACANELYGTPPHDLSRRVSSFILESGFTSIARLAERRQMQAPAHVEAIFDPIAKLRRGRHPLLILHGARDTLVRPDEAEDAHAAAGTDDKELVMLEGRGHNDISVAPAYWEKIASFLARTCA